MSKKWEKFKQESIKKNVATAPIIGAEQLNELYNNQAGYSVDTPIEVDKQKNNLGPKDSQMELKDINRQIKGNSKDDQTLEQENEHLKTPTPRP